MIFLNYIKPTNHRSCFHFLRTVFSLLEDVIFKNIFNVWICLNKQILLRFFQLMEDLVLQITLKSFQRSNVRTTVLFNADSFYMALGMLIPAPKKELMH